MEHRISAGVIVEDDARVLLVRHLKPGVYDFWVAPGGGALGEEDLRATAKREAFEECGLLIEIGRMLYIEEFVQPGKRTCKVWFAGRSMGGTLDCGAPDARSEHIVDAAWLTREELFGKAVFPPMLLGDYWDDKATGRTEPRYVGLRQMEFY
ncbi:MAG TPA: NUDIX hydrolase [Burkholderiaceae bacterium]|nr:NUDIX hydrolase [Burkholderiaceae bacterium]